MRAALAGWAGLAAAFAVRLGTSAQDDIYITYRYAENLARGLGLVFNPGERVFGLTEPGQALLLAALAATTRLGVNVLGTLVTAASLLAIAALLARPARQRGRAPEAWAGGALLLASSWLWAMNGGGWAPGLALLLFAARVEARRPAAAGVLAGLAAWFRPDLGLGAGLLALLSTLRRRRIAWSLALPALATLACGAAAAWIYFGSPIPNTLEGKRALAAGAGEGAAGLEFWIRAAGLAPRHFGRLAPLLAVAGALGAARILQRGGLPERLLMLFGAAVAVAYPLLGVPFAGWYLAPTVVAALYGAAHLGGEGLRLALAADRAPARRALGGATAGLLVALPVLGSFLPASFAWYRGFEGWAYLETYREAGEWLAEHAGPEERLACVEIGVVGYHSRLPVRDLMGLVTPAALPYVRGNDLPGAFLLEPTELVLHHPRGRMRPLIGRPWFRGAYREVARFADRRRERGPDRDLVIYRRLPGARLPPPRPPNRPPRREGSAERGAR